MAQAAAPLDRARQPREAHGGAAVGAAWVFAPMWMRGAPRMSVAGSNFALGFDRAQNGRRVQE
ncbi:hypothetical protein ACFPRL_17785 [Pseudoclavibacter helvolus]